MVGVRPSASRGVNRFWDRRRPLRLGL